MTTSAQPPSPEPPPDPEVPVWARRRSDLGDARVRQTKGGRTRQPSTADEVAENSPGTSPAQP